jgi:SOS-response transcriptional repressor LexA
MRNKLLKKKLRNAVKLSDKTASEIEKEIGVSHSTFWRMLNKEDYPVSTDDLERIAKATGMPISFFIDYEELNHGGIKIEESEVGTFQKVRKVPIISWVQAGDFNFAEDPFPLGHSDQYTYTTMKGANMFGLIVRGDSMEKDFPEGTEIIIDPDSEVLHEDFGIFKNVETNECTFKQLRIIGKHKILHPLNDEYEDIILDEDEKYIVVGKMVRASKKY